MLLSSNLGREQMLLVMWYVCMYGNVRHPPFIFFIPLYNNDNKAKLQLNLFTILRHQYVFPTYIGAEEWWIAASRTATAVLNHR